MNFVVSSEALLGVRGSLGTSSVLGDEREVPAPRCRFHTPLCVSPGIIPGSPDRLSGFSLSHRSEGEGEFKQLLAVPQAGTAQGKGSSVQPPQPAIPPESRAGNGSDTSRLGLITARLEKEEEWKVCSLCKAISSLQQSCETSQRAQKQTPPCAACPVHGWGCSWCCLMAKIPS